MRVRPISLAGLVDELVDRITTELTGRPAGGWLRVGIDSAPTAGGADLADALVAPLRATGRSTVRVDTADFLRPASVRLEFGRTNPDAFYESWYDLAALRREVLDPLAPDGSGRILRTFWNPTTDRATRSP